MLTNQQIFDSASTYLRTYGNPYGGISERGWIWVNSMHSSDRCVLASMVCGSTDNEVIINLANLLPGAQVECRTDAFEKLHDNKLVWDIIDLFDTGYACNIKSILESSLKDIATRLKLEYKEAVEEEEELVTA